MKSELNPCFETLFLLMSPEWDKEQKKEAIKEIDGIGINGAAFFKANFSVVERYTAAFQSRRTVFANIDFPDICEELFCSLIHLFWRHPKWFEGLEGVSDAEAFEAVLKSIIDPSDEEQDPVAFLEASGYSDKAKWQMSALLQQPKQRLSQIALAVSENLSAFEYAYAEHKAEIDILLAQLADRLDNSSPASLLSLPDKFNPDAEIIPTLASPLAIMIFDDFCFCGLLINKLLGEEDDGGFTKSEAIRAAKALGDLSKLDILLALKKESLYNLEIARLLDLTPATTSHHMSILLAAGFVSVMKQDGKAYYSFSQEGIRRYRDWLDENLL